MPRRGGTQSLDVGAPSPGAVVQAFRELEALRGRLHGDAADLADKLLSGLKPAVFASLAHEGNDGERWDLGDLVSRLEAWLTIRAGDDPAGSLPQPLNGPPASCSEEDTYVALFERLELLHDFALGLLRTELDRFQRDTAAADTAAEECQRRQAENSDAAARLMELQGRVREARMEIAGAKESVQREKGRADEMRDEAVGLRREVTTTVQEATVLGAEVGALSRQLREVKLGGVVGGASAQDYVSAQEVAAMEAKADAAESALAAERVGLAKLRASARKAQSRLVQTKSRAERVRRVVEARDEEARAGGAGGRPLTPRPDWVAVRRRVPALAEFEWALRQHLSTRDVHVADSEGEEGAGEPAEGPASPEQEGTSKKGGSKLPGGDGGAVSGTAVRSLALLRCALEVPAHVSLRKQVSDLRAQLQQRQREVEEARRGFQDVHRRVPEGLRGAVQPYMERAAAGLLSEDDAALGVARLLDQQRVLETRVERVKRLGWHEVRRAARPKQGIIRALGTGPEVPEYLRWAGEIPHRSYTLNDARALVREVWYAKSEQERMSGKATFLSDYLGGFLRRKFGIQNLVADCAYNLLAALEEHEGDVDVDTFFLALTNAVSDRIYVDQGVMLAHLRLLCVRLDLARAIGPRRATASVRAAVREGLLDELVRGQLESPSSVPALAVPGCTGRVLLDDLLLSLERFFPRKLDVRWREVAAEVEAAPRACPDSAWVHYPSLFPCDSQRGPQKGVVPTLRAQHLREIQEHHSLLERRLASEDRMGVGVLPIRAVKHALFALDEDLTHAIADTLLGAFREEEAFEQQRERERRAVVKRRASTLRSAIAMARHSGAAPARTGRSSQGTTPAPRGSAQSPLPVLAAGGPARPRLGGSAARDSEGEGAVGGEEVAPRSLHPDAPLRWKAFAKWLHSQLYKPVLNFDPHAIFVLTADPKSTQPPRARELQSDRSESP